MMTIAATGRAHTRLMATNDPELKSTPNPEKLLVKLRKYSTQTHSPCTRHKLVLCLSVSKR